MTLNYAALEPIDEAVTLIGPNGGVHHASNGAFLEVPEGALSETAPIQFTHTRAAETIPELPQDGYYLAFARLGPAGLTFSKPATLFLPLQEGIVIAEGTPIRISYFDEKDKRWVQDITSGVITDIDGQLYLEYEINHFTWIGGQWFPDEVTGCAVYSDGTPAAGISTNFGVTDNAGIFRGTTTQSDIGRSLHGTAIAPDGTTASVSTYYDGNGPVEFGSCIIIPGEPDSYEPEPDIRFETSTNSSQSCNIAASSTAGINPQSSKMLQAPTSEATVSPDGRLLLLPGQDLIYEPVFPYFSESLIDPSTIRIVAAGQDVTDSVEFERVERTVSGRTYEELVVTGAISADELSGSDVEFSISATTRTGKLVKREVRVDRVHEVRFPLVIPYIIADEDAEPGVNYPQMAEIEADDSTLLMVAFLQSDFDDGTLEFDVPVSTRDAEGNIMPFNTDENHSFTLQTEGDLYADTAPMVDGKAYVPVTIFASSQADWPAPAAFTHVVYTTTGIILPGSVTPHASTFGDDACYEIEYRMSDLPPYDVDKDYCVTFATEATASELSGRLRTEYAELHDLASEVPWFDGVAVYAFVDFLPEITDGRVDLGDRIHIPSAITVPQLRHPVTGGFLEFPRTLAVDVSELSDTGFTFRPVDRQHFLTSDGGVSFNFYNEGSGTVKFCVEARGRLASPSDRLQFYRGPGEKVEDAIWNDLLRNIEDTYGR